MCWSKALPIYHECIIIMIYALSKKQTKRSSLSSRVEFMFLEERKTSSFSSLLFSSLFFSSLLFPSHLFSLGEKERRRALDLLCSPTLWARKAEERERERTFLRPLLPSRLLLLLVVLLTSLRSAYGY